MGAMSPTSEHDPGRAALTPEQLTEAQQLVLAAASDPQVRTLLVAGGPGTGKTTLLVELAAASGLPLANVLVLSATRQLAQRLRHQLISRLGGAQLSPRVMTAHALAHSLVNGERARDERPWALLTAPEQEFRLRELLAGHDTSGWAPDLARAVTTRSFAAEVRAAVTRVRQLGLDPEDVVALGTAGGRDEWVVLGEFMDEYLDVVDATGEIDYAELVHRARLRLVDEQLLGEVTTRTPLILVDDVNELDASQLQLLADLVRGGSRLVAMADPSTAVYSFRGAQGGGLASFPAVFGEQGFNRIDLSVDLDRASHLTEALAHVAGRLPRNDAVPIPTPGGQAPGGTVEALVFESAGAEIDHLVHRLKTARLHEGLAWHDMAVITRSSRGAIPAIARALTSAGVPVHLPGSDIALREAVAVRPLLEGLRVIQARLEGRPCTPHQAQTLLRSPFGGLDSLGVRRLGRLLRGAHPGEPVSSGEWFAAMLDDPSLADGLEGDDVEAARALARHLAQATSTIEQGGHAAQALWQLWHETGWADRARAEALSDSDASPGANRDIDLVQALFDLAERDTQLSGVRSLRQLLDEVGSHEIPADTARERDAHRSGVELLTAHRTKGRRWPLVVVAQVQEGRWPATRRRASTLDIDRLTRDEVAPPEPFSRLIDAERRSFLLACSRASRHLVVTAAQGHEGEGDQASRFLSELGVEVRTVNGRPRRPISWPLMVAELRRAAMDPASSPLLREAAASRLGQLSQLRDGRGRVMARGADPQQWWGMADLTNSDTPVVNTDPQVPVALHGSDLGALLDCPRHWFLSRRARGEAASSAASSLGSVIHALVAHAVTDELNHDDLQQHLDGVWSQLSFEAQWLSVSEKREATVALERYLGWESSRSAAVLGTEVRFDVQVETTAGPVRLSGSVDRLELTAEGQLRVIDFKTGRRAPTKASVHIDPQLGVYQLVAHSGGFESLAPGVREVADAELVYLRVGDSQEFPTVLSQPSLDAKPWPDGVEESPGSPTWVHAALAQGAATVRQEQFVARACSRCRYCPFADSCPVIVEHPPVAR